MDNMADRTARSRLNHRGVRNPRCRLTSGDVAAIRMARGTATTSEMARRYGVSLSCIGHIWRGLNWRLEEQLANGGSGR